MGDWPDRTDEERRIEYARELSSWLRVPELRIEEASCLLFGWDPEVFRVTKPYNTQFAPIDPDVNTPHEFAELARRAKLHGSLDMKKDSRGDLYITPLNAFEFAQKQGLQMDEPLREVWSEALLESASSARDLVGDALDNPAGSLKISEGKTHEQSEHPSEIQITDKELEKNICAEWWISTDDGSFFFRTFTNKIEDGVAEFKRDTKNREVMVLLCERGNKGLSIAEILKAAYPKDLEKLEEILREAPRESTRDTLLDYYKNADVHKILKKAKQICWTVQQKLENKGIPNEVIEILPGLERFIVENPSAPMVFLRVQSLQKKSENGIRMHPSIVNASGLSEHDTNTNRPHVL